MAEPSLNKQTQNDTQENSLYEEYRKLESTWVRRSVRRRWRKRKVRLSRSWYGDLFLAIFILAFAFFSAYPLIFTIFNALKPLDELFIFPPKLFPRRMTFENFSDLFNLLGNTLIPISRYLFNTVMITVIGTVGHVFLASMAAYPLAKHHFSGKALINQLIVYSLMFSTAVTSIPTYMIVNALGLINTPWAIIIPSWGYTLGLFLMRQFMSKVPNELLEAAKIDGANEFRIYWNVVMPLVKPAWLTVIILLFQTLWSHDGGSYIFTESIKPLSYALTQIINSGIGRAGTAAAVSVIMMIVPISVFIINQTQIIDTMASSGLK